MAELNTAYIKPIMDQILKRKPFKSGLTHCWSKKNRTVNTGAKVFATANSSDKGSCPAKKNP